MGILTHYDGCEEIHPGCAARLRAERDEWEKSSVGWELAHRDRERELAALLAAAREVCDLWARETIGPAAADARLVELSDAIRALRELVRGIDAN